MLEEADGSSISIVLKIYYRTTRSGLNMDKNVSNIVEEVNTTYKYVEK